MKTMLATLVLLAPCLSLAAPGTDNPSSGTRPESFIPSNTQLDRTRSASASSFPTAASRGGHWDPLAVTGRHTYGSLPGRGLGWLAGSPSANPGFGSLSSAVSSTYNPGNIGNNIGNMNFPRFGAGGLSQAYGLNNLPPNGFGFGGVSPAALSQLGNYNPNGAWFMPHTQQWTDCDSAINPNCKKRKNSLFSNPLAYMASQNAMQYNSPAGWWQFHPAMSIRGTKDPLPTNVKAPQHLLSHYWGLMHPSNGDLNHAGSINPNQAFYMSGGAPGGSWFNNQFNNGNNFNNNLRMAGMEGPFNWAHTGATHGWFRPGTKQNGLTAAPLASDAGAFGPFAFEKHHELGSTFLPPHHVAEGPHHTNGVAPDSPFQSAPLFETLRAAAGSSFIPIPGSFADNINNINGTPNQGNLNLGGYGGKSANPGGNSNHPTAFGTVFDKRNNGVETVNSYEKPNDKVAIGPSLDAQKPAPDGPN